MQMVSFYSFLHFVAPNIVKENKRKEKKRE